jgi:hypothetical protein
MLNIKTLAMATAISAGAIFAMPVVSQAMPASSPVKVQTANDSNIVDVRYRRMSWARYCATHRDWRCRRSYAYRYRTYVAPYYYDDPYYYGYYRPYHYGPGINVGPLRFGFD